MSVQSRIEAEAVEVVARQLAAYNEKSLDDFMACWSATATIASFPDGPSIMGEDAIRERHQIRFKEPNLSARLLGRLVIGNIVVDREVVTRDLPEGVRLVDVLGIYEVENQIIIRAWFNQGAPRPVPPG